jgi:hypothetical protein
MKNSLIKNDIFNLNNIFTHTYKYLLIFFGIINLLLINNTIIWKKMIQIFKQNLIIYFKIKYLNIIWNIYYLKGIYQIIFLDLPK